MSALKVLLRRPAVRIALAIGVSTGLLALVLSRMDLARAWDHAQSFEPLWLGVAALCSLGTLLLRAQRFHALAERAPFDVVLCGVAVQNFLVRVTPMRTGELGLPVVLQRHAGEPMARTVVSVLIVRLLELWMLLLLGFGATLAHVGPQGGARLGTTTALVVVTSALVLTFRAWMARALALARRLCASAPRLSRGVEMIDRLAAAVRDTDRLGAAERLRLGLGTAAVAVTQYALFGALLAIFGVRPGLLAVLVGGTAAQLASAVPVPSVGNVGPLEAAWVAGFTWVGVDFDAAVVTAVGCQVITLAFAGAFALAATLYLARAQRGRDDAARGAP
jgi:uncharacterized membrane protein YbhN (UPF0104 family)